MQRQDATSQDIPVSTFSSRPALNVLDGSVFLQGLYVKPRDLVQGGWTAFCCNPFLALAGCLHLTAQAKSQFSGVLQALGHIRNAGACLVQWLTAVHFFPSQAVESTGNPWDSGCWLHFTYCVVRYVLHYGFLFSRLNPQTLLTGLTL